MKLHDLLQLLYKFIPKGKIQTFFYRFVRKQINILLVPPEAAGVELINQLFSTLQMSDPQQREAALLQLVHASLIYQDKTGPTLDRSIKEFSYKRALKSYGVYQLPIKVTEVHRGQRMAVGFQKTGQSGRIDKYFIAKKFGIKGPPAPIDIFFPDNGEPPRLINFGSL